MNLWRYLGITLFLLGGLCLISTAKLPVLAFAQDKDKTPPKDKDAGKDKDAAKDKDAGKDKDKTVPAKDKDGAKDKDKTVPAKDKDGAKDKVEVKTPPVDGAKLAFSALLTT